MDALILLVNESGKDITANKNNQFLPTCEQATDAIALKLENVNKVFNTRSTSFKSVVAIDCVSFQIRKGEFVSIVGPSGSGKSTLLNIMGALDRPTGGKVFIIGQDIFLLDDTRLSDIRNRMIGFIFQSYNLINRMSVQENVNLPALFLTDGTFSDKGNRALELLQTLGIRDKAELKPTDLSGGEQQRVAIARALINEPALVLADEPTGNLDTKTGREVFDLLKMLSVRFGTTIGMVTHNLELAALTDRSIYIRDGRIEKEVSHINDTIHLAKGATQAASTRAPNGFSCTKENK